MFRGSELPRLLAMVTFLILGLAMVFTVLTRQQSVDQRPAPRVARERPLPPPDDSPELLGVVDKARLTPRENPGYLTLLERIRSVDPATLALDSRRDVVYSQLLDNPRRYRGLPIHIEGTARRTLFQPAEESQLYREKAFYESYVFTGDSQNFPYILVFEEPPEDLLVGDDLFQRVVFDGYFFKLLRYKAADAERYAPMLIGRVRYAEPHESALPTESGLRLPSPGWLALIAALLGLTILRWVLYVRGALRKQSRPVRQARPPVNEEISPEALQSWLTQSERDLPEPPGSGAAPGS
jgi:hypothetical protein